MSAWLPSASSPVGPNNNRMTDAPAESIRRGGGLGFDLEGLAHSSGKQRPAQVRLVLSGENVFANRADDFRVGVPVIRNDQQQNTQIRFIKRDGIAVHFPPHFAPESPLATADFIVTPGFSA